MADSTAQLSDYRQSPRKVGRVADVVRGKRVSVALAALDAMPKRAAGPLAKLIRSAVANARSKGITEAELVISKVQVGKGIMLKRSWPRARGSSALVRKKASHVKIELSRKEAKVKKTGVRKAVKGTVAKKAKKEEVAAE